MVTTKHNDDKQYIWESDASSFTIVEDPRGDTLGRGTQVSLFLKEEAYDYLEQDTVKTLVKKYSQFINFNIFMWSSTTETVEEPIEEEEAEEAEKKEDEEKKEEDEDAAVEEEKEEEEKPKTKKVEKTTWDWILVNESKPIWTRKPDDIEEQDYVEFYKSITKDTNGPMTHTHFIAEGEVTFKSLLFVPVNQPSESFNKYGSMDEQIKLYVRRVFITDDFKDMMPNYLSFVRGVVDSDDLPLNVSRDTLQQHKLLKVIKKKLVRKTLDMIKKISDEDYKAFWEEYSTNIKLGVMEDHSNRTRLAKLLRFYSSHSATEQTSLQDYVERMKEKQENIFFVAGTSRASVEASPFVERLLKKGYEVLYLIEPVDEYCMQSLPEFEGKKFQNAAKEGLKVDTSEAAQARKDALKEDYKPLTEWLKETALKDKIEKAAISERLDKTPCALVASSYGWSGNMERIMHSQAYAKAKDPNKEYHASQKRTLELNPRHPLVKKLKALHSEDTDSQEGKDLAVLLFETATLRSGYMLQVSAGFGERIERMLRKSMDIDLAEEVEAEPEDPEKEDAEEEDEEEVDA